MVSAWNALVGRQLRAAFQSIDPSTDFEPTAAATLVLLAQNIIKLFPFDAGHILAMWAAAANAHVIVANQVMHFIYVLISGHSVSPLLLEQQVSLPSVRPILQLSAAAEACCRPGVDVSTVQSHRYRRGWVDQAACWPALDEYG